MASPRPLPIHRSDEPRGSTKQRLIDAAERLIIERGLEGFSVRAVTQAAGVSVSAANYHFGSKEALVRTTLLRTLAPLNARQLEALDAVEVAARAAGRPPRLEDVVQAFFRPPLALRSVRGAGHTREILARVHVAPPEQMEAIRRDLLNPTFEHFVDAMERALPGRDRERLELSFQMVIGAMLHMISGQAERLNDLGTSASDTELMAGLVCFGAGGILASCPEADA